MNKEQLIKENTLLLQSNKDLAQQNNKLKEDFCKILGLYRTKNMYGINEKVEVSWAEVFAEIGIIIGKLTSGNDFKQLTSKCDELSLRIVDIENKFNESKQ